MERIDRKLMDVTLQTITTHDVYPGYPKTRLYIPEVELDWPPTLPNGDWQVSQDNLPSPEEQRTLMAKGYQLDELGRPLHPWLRDMITNPEVGVVTGKGFYYHWGPNCTADPIILSNDDIPKVLLIQRGDTGVWALPGGFIDGDETAANAAIRELQEEANLAMPSTAKGIEIYSGVVADLRATAHGWPETTAIAWRVANTPTVSGNDDAQDARWFSANELPKQLHGSHAILVQQALVRIDELPLVQLETPRIKPVIGGHMGYSHHIITQSSGKSHFVKAHNDELFTDLVRADHSRQYLKKEKLIYDHVRRQGFTDIPSEVRLEQDTLFMQALDPDDGWHWRAPLGQEESYIESLFGVLRELSTIKPLEDFSDILQSSHEAHVQEGWEMIDDMRLVEIADKLRTWSFELEEKNVLGATQLADNLPVLQDEFYTLKSPQDFSFTHHDLRQANVAWHPDHGVRLVDWSWAGLGRRNSDSTTLLIDLQKSNIPHLKPYIDHYFNRDHALTMIGFWLNHSLMPTRTGDNNVRFHQAASAVAAYNLLCM